MQNLLKKLFLILTVIIAIYFGVYFIIFGIFGSWQHTRHEVYYFNNDKSYYTDEVRDSLLYNKYPATVSLISTTQIARQLTVTAAESVLAWSNGLVDRASAMNAVNEAIEVLK